MLLHGNLTQFGNVLCGAYKGAKAETSISMQRIVWSGNKLTEENTGRSIATVKDKELKKKGIGNELIFLSHRKYKPNLRINLLRLNCKSLL